MFIKASQKKGHVLSSRNVYTGHIFSIFQQTIDTPDGLRVERDLIKHAAAVALLAITPDDQVLINREYRVAINAESYAFPAGLINPEESPSHAAKRELEEETGFVAQSLSEMCTVRSSEGMTDENVHLFLAHIDPAKRTNKNFDQDEFVTSQLVPLQEVIDAVQKGIVASAQTVSALCYYLAFVRPAAKGAAL